MLLYGVASHASPLAMAEWIEMYTVRSSLSPDSRLR